MKTFLVLVAGIVLGVLASVLGAWLYLGHVTSLMAESTQELPLDAKGRVEKSVRAYRDAKDDYGRWLARTDGAVWTVDVEPAAKAREDAIALLSASENYRTDWNYGNAVHK